jgi:hypothetical protein
MRCGGRKRVDFTTRTDFIISGLQEHSLMSIHAGFRPHVGGETGPALLSSHGLLQGQLTTTFKRACIRTCIPELEPKQRSRSLSNMRRCNDKARQSVQPTRVVLVRLYLLGLRLSPHSLGMQVRAFQIAGAKGTRRG